MSFPSLPFVGSVSSGRYGMTSSVVLSEVVAVAVAVIGSCVSLVIAVPAGVDHVGCSYPPFTVTAGYLSAGRTVPSLTSYTLLFAMLFTPSPALNVTLR